MEGAAQLRGHHKDRFGVRMLARRISIGLWAAAAVLNCWGPLPNGADAAFVSLRPIVVPSQSADFSYRWYMDRHLAARKLTSEEVQARLAETLARLRAKDRSTTLIPPDELNIVFEDDSIVVVDKPAGVLSVPSEPGVPSLAESVLLRHLQQQGQGPGPEPLPAAGPERIASINQMVVHRLGMDTSGLVVFAKSREVLRAMNTLFRTRKVTRQYEALVCGHIGDTRKHGLINLPLMRDYEHPLFMRISTDEHQRNLLDLDADVVGRKLLRAPMPSLTHFQVAGREYYGNRTELPVTRLTLTSISGRTHQLNVHCAAYGHPIVHDLVYGYNGEAAPHGGLAFEDTLSSDRASPELQRAIYEASKDGRMCIHSKVIRFKHPATKEMVEFTSPVPF